MKKVKKICFKLLAVILICVIICPVSGTETVHAASISKDRAEQMYVYVLKKWLAQGVYVTPESVKLNASQSTKSLYF